MLHTPNGRSDVLAFVAQNLRRLRLHSGLSQAALAQASGISRRMIVNLEGGETNISLSSLDRLAEALGASFVDLVSDPEAHSRRIEAVAWRGARPESEAVLLGSVPARSEAQLWTNIVLPGALPFIVTGLRLAVGRGLIGMVLADLYTAISGIGYLIVRTASTYQVDKMFVPIVTLGVLGVTLTALLRLLEIKVAPWTVAGRGD